LDYSICQPELRSVDFTVAPKTNFQLQAHDATASSKKIAKLASVWITSLILQSLFW